MAQQVVLGQRWELGAQIGEGGFGKVFEARSEDGQQAVVKLIDKEPGHERELQFPKAGARNVVPVIDQGEHEDQWAIVMPQADKSLKQHLAESGGTLPLDEVVQVLRDVAAALADLDGDVVHRDLKPANILLLDGIWCLADFGMARVADAETAPHTWKFGGTTPYMAPERWRMQRATIASDIYSLGVIAHELILGTWPFTGPYDSDFQHQHLHEDPPARPGVPAALDALVEECLNKSPNDRPNPGNLVVRLEKIQQVPRTGGLAALAAAHRDEAARRAEAARRQSQHQSELEQRKDQFRAAKNKLTRISQTVLDAVMEAAPSARLDNGAQGGWAVTLNRGRLKMSAAYEADLGIWRQGTTPRFDVIAYATISLECDANYRGYQGRNHSLWYCDAQTEGEYHWYETAFMTNPIVIQMMPAIEPYALIPGPEARAALGSGMDVRQVAWPFEAVDITDLDVFIDRWTQGLANAAAGQLNYPSTMPERPTTGTWR
ncbi:serine/threonine-protein kinase [Kitasatospora sp. NPDC058048]|uniref:serine/threonine-protein kinase n=1 Tax=Kitasatospora sp. NPDC058048 TaxID=3346313 RepID=UPI0036DC5747